METTINIFALFTGGILGLIFAVIFVEFILLPFVAFLSDWIRKDV